MSRVFVVAAQRTPVAPRLGAFARLEAATLGAHVLQACLAKAGLEPSLVDEVIMGNALYGGGNPARVAALAAGLPEAVPALTIDSQCCAGLDAILLAASRIRAGEAHAILAGGLESYSRSPLRAVRPRSAQESPQAYERPPFSPWPDRDPEMAASAAALAAEFGVTRSAQEAFAVESHRRALAASPTGEIAQLDGLGEDAFARRLSLRACGRLPVLAGDGVHGLTAATIAVEADAAACVLVVSEAMAERRGFTSAIRLTAGRRMGAAPERPALAAAAAARPLMERYDAGAPQVSEIMEAFAVQAELTTRALGLDPASVNRGGGALSRGHPIGASGAILAVRLFHEMLREPPGARGLAAIAAAGGLGSAALFERA
ncbi:MAG: acetyl-CoA acetyltransferase [Hyphomicrobiales bacterium]|nr:acetyl-CoA acetyltransferase [Hyphomicrobiales bacterium]